MSEIEKLQDLISAKFTPEVLEDILKKESNSESVLIKDIKLGGESKKGDSYLSTVTRFSVDYQCNNGSGDVKNHTIHLIAKGLPKNIGRRKTFRSTDFFANEVAFYNKVWPALDAFQRSKNVQNPFNEIPKCLSSCADGINDYIVMEDLSYEGYGSAQRNNGLNQEHILMIMKLFARFHAIAVAYRDQHSQEFEKTADELMETYFSEKYRDWYEKFQGSLKNICRDAIARELPEKYLLKINALLEKDFFGIICKSCEERGPLAAITHGDAWIPNFLIKYGESGTNPLHTIMIDFQLTRCSSISLDIFFFLYSCTESVFLEKHFDEVLAYYCAEFNSSMKDLGSDSSFLTVEKLKADMMKHIAFGIGMSMEAVTMSLLEEDEVADLDEIEGDDKLPLETVWIIHPFKTKEKRQRLAAFIKHAVDAGYLV